MFHIFFDDVGADVGCEIGSEVDTFNEGDVVTFDEAVVTLDEGVVDGLFDGTNENMTS